MKKILVTLVFFAIFFFTANATAFPPFQINSFAIEPSLAAPSTANPTIEVNPIVMARSLTAGSETVTVRIKVTSPAGTEVFASMPVTKVVSSTPEKFDKSDGIFFSVDTSWQNGHYLVYVEARDQSGAIQDQKSLILTVNQKPPEPVPEIPFFFAPLIAAALLFIIAKKRAE